MAVAKRTNIMVGHHCFVSWKQKLQSVVLLSFDKALFRDSFGGSKLQNWLIFDFLLRCQWLVQSTCCQCNSNSWTV